MQSDVRESAPEGVRGLPGQGFPAAEDPAQSGARSGVRLREEDLEHRGYEVTGGDGLFVDQPGQMGGVLVAAGFRDDERRAPRSGQKNSHTDTSNDEGVFCSTRSSVVSA